ncbi:two-component sensor histidine kinase [Diaminobutyricibacter tongyongensis]|uniref:Sensor-like histidine kinase SenX3 n=1 Tax=Leifsonia tongyongensis TaxID=1268043 RepID=A0A6L9XSD6_9MICO|nr:ATP-binding protein [Diaminobutyricibacter tongyongensis]NEN04329.1 two-component sensor histidine kinase [Diaminobutyricibacter tongyongensis]
MDSTWLVLLSLALGLVVGAGFVAILYVAARRGAHAADVASPAVPDGVDQVIDALESAAIVLDPSNNVIKASPGALSIGLVWNQALVHPHLVDLVGRVRRTGEPITEECELARGPFGEANIHLSVRVARLGSRYILLLAEDRTESFRLEQVRRDFVANISHELKTPIGAVGLLAEALDSASEDPEQVRRFAHRLTEESQRLARITQDIIELSRLQAADALTDAEIVSVKQVITSAVDQNRVAAEARGIELAMRGDKRAEVYGDEALLVTAVHNLVSNAIQYSPAGSRVGIGVRIVDGVVEIAVTDQGEGIPEDDLDRVFERFFRVDQARSRHTGGTGLGLAIVKHAVQNHGGDIRVWSQPGRGSTFTIRLPEASHDAAVRPAIGETT